MVSCGAAYSRPRDNRDGKSEVQNPKLNEDEPQTKQGGNRE
jgi:hypothetical protein